MAYNIWLVGIANLEGFLLENLFTVWYIIFGRKEIRTLLNLAMDLSFILSLIGYSIGVCTVVKTESDCISNC